MLVTEAKKIIAFNEAFTVVAGIVVLGESEAAYQSLLSPIHDPNLKDRKGIWVPPDVIRSVDALTRPELLNCFLSKDVAERVSSHYFNNPAVAFWVCPAVREGP